MVAFRFLYLGLLIGTALAVPVYPRSDIDDVFLAAREPANSRKGSQSSLPDTPYTPWDKPKTKHDRPYIAAAVPAKYPGSEEKPPTGSRRSPQLDSSTLDANYNTAQNDIPPGTSRLSRAGATKYLKVSPDRFPKSIFGERKPTN